MMYYEILPSLPDAQKIHQQLRGWSRKKSIDRAKFSQIAASFTMLEYEP